MKTSFTSSVYIFLKLIFCVLSLSYSACIGSETKNIKISMMVNQQNIIPCQPLGVAVLIENKGKELEQIRNTSLGINLFVRKQNQKEWMSFSVPSTANLDIRSNTQFIKPGDKIWGYINLVNDYKGRSVFPNSGNFFVKIIFGDSGTPPLKIVVKSTSGKDLDIVRELGLYSYFSSETAIRKFISPHYIGHRNHLSRIRLLQNRYPQSKLIDWINIAENMLEELPLISSRLEGRGLESSVKEPLVKVKNDFIRMSRTSAYPVNASALYEAGFILALMGKMPEAKPYFDKAGLIDKTLFYRHKVFLKKYASLFVVFRSESDSSAILSKSIDDLKGQGYRVAEFSVDNPAMFKEYSSSALSILQKKNDGLISEREYYERLSKVLINYIKNYAKKN